MAAQKKTPSQARPAKRQKQSKSSRKEAPKKPRIDVKPQNYQPIKTNDFVDMTFQEKCDLIADLSESILEDPTSAFSSSSESSFHNEGSSVAPKGSSKIRQLLDLAKPDKNGMDDHVARLAVVSLVAIFRDIIPTYRVRLPTAAETSVKVSKETKKLWDYERELLSHYQQFLKLLERTWDRGNKENASKPPSSLAITSVLSLCELLKSAYHFNFRANILSVVVRQMNNRQCEEISQACCTAVEHVFASDVQGEVALEAARMVAKMIKDRSFRVQPGVVHSFCALPLRVHDDEAQAAKLAAAANAKKRKRDKEGAEIEKEMKEGSASVDKIVLARCQSDTLQAVTLTYFRILKSEDLTADHIVELLPPTLEGLAKFAHLINIDTVTDLLTVLKSLLKKVDDLPLEGALNCVLTAFQALQGPGREMQIDQKEYITPLYSQLPLLCSERATEGSRRNSSAMLKCLDAAFIKRREYSNIRIAAFIKQICSVALHAPPHTAASLLAFVRQLLQRYPSAQQLVENEQDVITSGRYNPDVEDPELSNPLATSAWELATLKFHVHSAVADQAKGAATLSILQLPAEAPERRRRELLQEANELRVSYKRVQKRHPLAPRTSSTSASASAASNKRQRREVRFVTPRKTSHRAVGSWL
jgi:nucleolar complex protein 3